MALDIDPNDERALDNKGAVHMSLGYHTQAIPYFDKEMHKIRICSNRPQR